MRIVFTTSNFPLSRVIRFLTQGEASHCHLEYPSGMWGGEWAVEAWATGVRAVPAWRARLNHRVVAVYECKFETAGALREVGKLVGQPYDFAGLIRLGWVLFWRWLGVSVRKPLGSTRGQFCTEVIARFIMAAKLPEAQNWDPEALTPKDLVWYCRTHPEWFVRIK